MTPHIISEKHDIASVVIMPGDPMRAKYIAEKFLENYHLVNNVRLMLAYTGTYKGKEITVMASGMGMPSIGIYAYELYNYYDVAKIIRIGSCGSYYEEIKLNDIILAENAYTSSNFAYQYNGKNINKCKSSVLLDQKIISTAHKENIEIKIGSIHTSDLFYNQIEDLQAKENFCMAVDMETFALFYIAKENIKEASSILTVSDNLVTKEKMTPEERETTFDKAIILALESLLK